MNLQYIVTKRSHGGKNNLFQTLTYHVGASFSSSLFWCLTTSFIRCGTMSALCGGHPNNTEQYAPLSSITKENCDEINMLFMLPDFVPVLAVESFGSSLSPSHSFQPPDDLTAVVLSH